MKTGVERMPCSSPTKIFVCGEHLGYRESASGTCSVNRREGEQRSGGTNFLEVQQSKTISVRRALPPLMRHKNNGKRNLQSRLLPALVGPASMASDTPSKPTNRNCGLRKRFERAEHPRNGTLQCVRPSEVFRAIRQAVISDSRGRAVPAPLHVIGFRCLPLGVPPGRCNSPGPNWRSPASGILRMGGFGVPPSYCDNRTKLVEMRGDLERRSMGANERTNERTNLRNLPLVADENSLAGPVHGVENPRGAVCARRNQPGPRGVEADVQDLVVVAPERVDALSGRDIPHLFATEFSTRTEKRRVQKYPWRQSSKRRHRVRHRHHSG